MKKIHKIFIGIAIISVVAVLVILSRENNNGDLSENIPDDILNHIASKSDLIKVDFPKPISVINSPLVVKGEARGTWYFEGDFPITLVDWDGRIIAESHASFIFDPNDPESTWMTEEFVPFEGTIEFDLSEENRVYNRGAIIFQKDNPSGLSEHDDALEIPILFE